MKGVIRMINLTVKTEDFEGEVSEVVCQFHLNKTELTELNLRYAKEGGLEGKMKQIEQENDPEAMFMFIKELMILGYGVKTEDGKAFIKKPELTEQFRYGYILPECMVKIMEDETGKGVINFVKGMMPKSTQDAINQEIQTRPELARFR